MTLPALRLASAAAAAEVVVSMLENGAIVESVLFDQGAAAAMKPGTLVIDMASIKPREARDTFRRLRVEHPADYRAQQAQLYLDYIARNFPNLPPPGELPKRKAPAKALEEYPEEEIPDPSPAG